MVRGIVDCKAGCGLPSAGPDRVGVLVSFLRRLCLNPGKN